MARELLEGFIGPRSTAYYLRGFDSIGKRGGGVRPSWNWPAFLFSAAWALYRKMYIWFFGFWGITIVAGIVEKAGVPWVSSLLLLISMILFGLYANALYFGRATRAIAHANTALDDAEERVDYLRRKGGVHAWVPWVFGAIPAVGIVAAVALPLLHDRTPDKRGTSTFSRPDSSTYGTPVVSTALPIDDKERLSGRTSIANGMLVGNIYNGTSHWTVTEIIINLYEPNWFIRAIEANKNGLPVPRFERYRVPINVPPLTNREFSISVNWEANEQYEWNIDEARGTRN